VSLIGLGVFTLVYGTVQMHSAQLRPGPKVAVIQENFPISVTRVPQNDRQIFDAHRKLTLQASETYKPDLIVWPESMAQPFLYPEVREQASKPDAFTMLVDGKSDGVSLTGWRLSDFGNAQYAQTELSKLASKVNAHLLVGSSARTYGWQDNMLNRQEYRNSAFLCRSDGLILHQRYDKMHPVPFSEYIPLRKSIPLFRKLVIACSPYDSDYSMEHGSGPEIFAFTTSDGQSSFRFATPICYEGTVADLCRKFVLPENEPKIDFLVNVSNDGWFNASWELSQHLVCYVFRAVENRIAIARAVNTGISGFVDSAGRLHDLVSENGRTRGVAGLACARLQIDSRISVYSRTGDWFALLCGLCALALFVDSLRGPWRGRRAKLLLVLMTAVMLADAVGRWLF
ncbi:MAG: apolipoprotein N-acyltransferase, partial [Phycisphaerae bacterium]|nr:apolipoprotein N-acyltransferase [Phycisphaerae bacterium]